MKQIYPGLFHIELQSQKEIASTFSRVYAHYESPKFRGKIFTEKQFNSWFKNKTPFGNEYGLRYRDIAAGINAPDYVFTPFLEGKFNPLNKSEQSLINEIRKIRSKKFYIISTLKDDDLNFTHEFAHGLYYLNKSYRKNAIKILKEFSKKQYSLLEQYLTEESLTHKDIIDDEIHAQLLTHYYLFINIIDEEKLFNISKKLENNFKQKNH